MSEERSPELQRNIRKTALILAAVAALVYFGFILSGVLRG